LRHYFIDFYTNKNDQIIDLFNINLKIEFLHTDTKKINFDLFAYVMIFDRYISEKFYEIIIDSNVSTKLIVKYKQYLTFKRYKVDFIIDLDFFNSETVNVQFDIESASSIKSFIIDTLFEIMKFHMIKTYISSLLNVADINRLKFYFNNVENTLNIIIQSRKLSIIRRFDHEFLL
jgi:hypothetical protein